MHTTVHWRLSPEERELELKKAVLAGLEDTLADRELEFETFKAELAAFERLYQSVVGVRHVELDELEAQIAGAQAGRNAASQASAQPAGGSARTGQSFRSHHGAAAGPDGKPRQFHASESLKTLWREAAKRIHPDLATDLLERTRRNATMAEVNEAYAARDEARLLEILCAWEERPEAVLGEDAAAELIRIIRKLAHIERRLYTLEGQFTQLRESELCRLRLRVEAAAREGRDLLEEMAAHLEASIEDAHRQLMSLRDRDAQTARH